MERVECMGRFDGRFTCKPKGMRKEGMWEEGHTQAMASEEGDGSNCPDSSMKRVGGVDLLAKGMKMIQ